MQRDHLAQIQSHEETQARLMKEHEDERATMMKEHHETHARMKKEHGDKVRVHVYVRLLVGM